jgi:hypothetical protein
MRDDLLGLFQRDELKKYLTEQELAGVPATEEQRRSRQEQA